ncbi:MAG: hypothetical protein K2G70_03715 [Turicibacter sp.]|nr:hypothetical protein [Turicibacter sp.]
MKSEWTIQLNNHIYGCYEQQLTVEKKSDAHLATKEEQIAFLNELMTIELDELKDAYLIERVDTFREHLKALNFDIEFFHAWNEVSANSYTEYTKIEHQKDKEIVACYKMITTPEISKNQEIIDKVGPLEAIELTKYEVAKDSKIGSIKLQLLDMGLTEMKA